MVFMAFALNDWHPFGLVIWSLDTRGPHARMKFVSLVNSKICRSNQCTLYEHIWFGGFGALAAATGRTPNS